MLPSSRSSSGTLPKLRMACSPCDINNDWSLLYLDSAATPYTLSVGYNDSLNGTLSTVYTAGYPGAWLLVGLSRRWCACWAHALMLWVAMQVTSASLAPISTTVR